MMQKKYKSVDLNSPNSFALKLVNYFVLIVFVFIILMPILIVFNISFKSAAEYAETSFMTFPRSFMYVENYITVFTQARMLTGFKNTLILATVPTIFSLIMGTMVAYILSRFRTKFVNIIFNMFVLSIMIPTITTQVATFTIIKSLGLFNTIFAGIVLYVATDLTQIYIFLQFLDKIPKEIDESGLTDGASYFRIYANLIFPQLRPALTTAAIIKFIAIYNDMFTPYLYMPKSNLRTITTAILSFSGDRVSDWNLMAAGIVIVLFPTLILYLVFQKFIISGLSDGAVKM